MNDTATAGEQITTGNSSELRRVDFETKNPHITWYALGSFGLIVLLVGFSYIAYRLLCSRYNFEEEEQRMRDFLSSSAGTGSPRLKRRDLRTGSKSMPIIVKLPSLTESSVAAPESLDRAALLTVPSRVEAGGSASKSVRDPEIRKVMSKSLKISEFATAEMLGKISLIRSIKDPQFKDEIRGLNEELLRVIQDNHKSSHYYDYTAPLEDYIKEMAKLKEKYPVKAAPLFSFGGSPAAPFNNIFGTPKPNPTSNNLTEPAAQISTNDVMTSSTNQEEEPEEEDAQPPEPNVDKFVETNVKFEVRSKLYERIVEKGSAPEIKFIGCGTLFVKELDTPKKLHLIVRQEPDLRRVLLNETITQHIPVKMSTKSIQVIVPGSDGQTKFYIAKVRDETLAKQLYEVLNTVNE